jgi:hypothetical protein
MEKPMSKINLDTEIENCKDELQDAIMNYREIIDRRERRAQLPTLASYRSKIFDGSTCFGINTEYYRQMVYENQPYSFFVTLTFCRNVTFQQICQYCTTLIQRFNTLEFGRGYYNRGDFITGFAFFEMHSDNERSNDYHIHLLIKHHDEFDESDFLEHLQNFHKASSKIMDGLNRPVFNDECIYFKDVYDDGAIEYCFKDLWDKNLDRLKFIGVDGLSDNQ